MKRRIYALAWFLFFLFIILVQTANSVTTLRFGVNASKEHPWSIAIIKLKERVEKESNGEIRVEVLTGQEIWSLGPPVSSVQQGLLALALVSSKQLAPIVKALQVYDLPFLFKDRGQTYVATSGSFGAQLLKQVDEQGFVGLSFTPAEFKVIVSNRNPIKKPKDLIGLKVIIPTLADDIQKKTLKTFSAAPVPLAFAEVYPALQTGIAGTTIATPSFLHKIRLYEVIRFATVSPIYYTPGVIVANQEAWEGLLKDQKKIIKDAISFVVKMLDPQLEKFTDFVINKMKEEKVDIFYLKDLTEFKKAVSPVYEFAITNKVPRWVFQNAMAVSYDKFDLKVKSDPQGAEVSYCTRFEKNMNKEYTVWHDPTDTVIENLYYAIWIIQVQKKGYLLPKPKEFDPFRAKNNVVSFKLKK